MSKKIFPAFFLLIVLADLYAIYSGNAILQYVVKPMILFSLIGYFIVQVVGLKPGPAERKLPVLVIDGLILSSIGDILLMMDSDPKFFMLGLLAFLGSHIFYILSFNTIRKKEVLPLVNVLFLPVALYYGLLLFFLFPVLGDMRIPVVVYGAVLSTMFVLALHMTKMEDKTAGRWIAIGAALFVISDSTLAFNKFYQPFDWAGYLTITTYASAQYFIVMGVLRYMHEKQNKGL